MSIAPPSARVDSGQSASDSLGPPPRDLFFRGTTSVIWGVLVLVASVSGDGSTGATALLVLLATLVSSLVVTVVVYRDAKRHRLPAVMWALRVLILGPFGFWGYVNDSKRGRYGAMARRAAA